MADFDDAQLRHDLEARRILSRWDDRYSADVRAVVFVRVS